jgi:WD40 repeat protein
LVPNPKDVQVRYGVLNEHNLDFVFICRDGGLRRFNLRDLKEEPTLVSHPDGEAIWRGVFSADGKTFFSGHQNGEVLVWDSESWEIRYTISVSDKPIRELAAAPDGLSFVAEGAEEMELWSLDGEPKKVAGVGQRFNFGEGLAFSPTGDLIATGGMFDINLMDAKTGEARKSMNHASYTMGLMFSPDGKFIASAPRANVNKFVGVFSLESGEQLFNAGPFNNYIAGMAFTPDGKRIAATGCEKLLRIFDSTTGEIVLAFERPECGSQPAFSRDGQVLAWSEPDGFHFIDLRKPE